MLFRSDNYTSGRRVGNFDINHTAAVWLSTAKIKSGKFLAPTVCINSEKN